MIYTVTFNPAIDYVVFMDHLKSGEVNRTIKEDVFVGGKGINVSAVLNELDIQSRALGFVAGFTGDALEKNLRNKGIDTDFVRLSEGLSRINVKIKAKTETDINGQGPEIGEDAIRELFEKLDLLKNGDTLVLAGSIPNTLPEDIYERILERLYLKGVRFVVDATGKLLENVLKYRPFLIKPNNFELSEIFGRELKTEEDIVEHARLLRQRGAKNVIVSMAGDGSILVDENDKVHKMGVPKGKVVNSVGSGDSMVAGFLAGLIKGNDYESALKMGAAAGSATAFSEGLAAKEDIYRLLEKL